MDRKADKMTINDFYHVDTQSKKTLCYRHAKRSISFSASVTCVVKILNQRFKSHELQHLRSTNQNAQGLPHFLKKVFAAVISLKTFHPRLKRTKTFLFR